MPNSTSQNWLVRRVLIPLVYYNSALFLVNVRSPTNIIEKYETSVVVRSSAKAKYRTMTLVPCELIWLNQLLKELKFEKSSQKHLVCHNQIAIHSDSNPIFCERTKHIEVDCHLIRGNMESGIIIRCQF